MPKRIITFMLTLIMVAALMPFEASAATDKVSMTAYDQVIKSGKTVYCAGSEGIYKVKVNSKGAVKSKKLLYKPKSETWGNYSYFNKMKKKGKYIYCEEFREGTRVWLVRFNTSTGKRKVLVDTSNQGEPAYAIKGKKIYYKFDLSNKKMVMKLNGKSKKKTSVTPKMKTKKSNAKGYSVIITEKMKGDEEIITTYLKTPAGKYKLGSHKGGL